MPWFGTVRGRLGVEPSEHWLLYVTGGLAYAQIKSTAATSAVAMTPGGTFTAAMSSSVNNDRAGWTAGVGAEWMFAKQWSAKVEYLYMDYGHINDGFTGVGTLAVLGISSHVTDNVAAGRREPPLPLNEKHSAKTKGRSRERPFLFDGREGSYPTSVECRRRSSDWPRSCRAISLLSAAR